MSIIYCDWSASLCSCVFANGQRLLHKGTKGTCGRCTTTHRGETPFAQAHHCALACLGCEAFQLNCTKRLHFLTQQHICAVEFFCRRCSLHKRRGFCTTACADKTYPHKRTIDSGSVRLRLRIFRLHTPLRSALPDCLCEIEGCLCCMDVGGNRCVFCFSSFSK